MPVSPEQLAEWKAQLLSNNMMDVLNAMLAISEAGDTSATRLLTLAGQNVSGMAKTLKLQMPDGLLTFEEFRQRQIAKAAGQAPASGSTAASREAEDRLTRFKQFAIRAPATFIIDHALDFCRKLIEARNLDVSASPDELYRKVKGLSSVSRAEDGDPSGTCGGQFAYSMQAIDDPECRAVFSRVDRRMRVELTDELYDMQRIRSFWMRDIRPQQFAFYRIDLLARFEALPADGWVVGPT